MIIVPTRELAQQVSQVVSSFSAFCGKDIRAVNLTQKISEEVQRSLLADFPDVIVSTPSRICLSLNSSVLALDTLTHLVIDEADLVLSYGYEEDLLSLSESIPKGVQKILMSATLSAEVETLKKLFCQNPVVLELDEGEVEDGGISQFVVKYVLKYGRRKAQRLTTPLRCAEDDKFLLAYVIFKLKLIKGKCIIFVGDIDRGYRLKLFLEQFGIKSCILNSEVPVNSRIHVVEEFNKSIYEIIIATDEQEVLGVRAQDDNGLLNLSVDAAKNSPNENQGDHGDVTHIDDSAPDDQTIKDTETQEKKQKKRRISKKSKEYGVARGIDFRNVACVLNFDLPTSSRSYTHRIGRTARAGKTGMALSLVVSKELHHKHKATTIASTEHDDEVLEQITRQQRKKGREVKPYHFDMKQVEAFRYRAMDALNAVTRIAIRNARTRELRQELLNSEKLKRHFEENPDDLQHLRHDGEIRTVRVQAHLKHVPDYLMPSTGSTGIASGSSNFGFVPIHKASDNRIRRARMTNRSKGKGGPGRKGNDPLKTFNAKGRGKK